MSVYLQTSSMVDCGNSMVDCGNSMVDCGRSGKNKANFINGLGLRELDGELGEFLQHTLSNSDDELQ